MKERESALNDFKAQNVSKMMKDMSVSAKEPWNGPGPDPRNDKWDENEVGEDEDEEDSGDDIDKSEQKRLDFQCNRD